MPKRIQSDKATAFIVRRKTGKPGDGFGLLAGKGKRVSPANYEKALRGAMRRKYARGVPRSVKSMTYSEFRRKIDKIFEEITRSQKPVIITRADGKDVVLMPLEYWESTMETLHLMSSPANYRALKKSLSQFKRGDLIKKALDEQLAREARRQCRVANRADRRDRDWSE